MPAEARAALVPAERRAVAVLSAIYATRMLGLFLLLPVLALHAGALPGGTPLLAGLAVGAYGLAQAVMQIPFGTWSDRFGRRPVITAGLLLHVAGSALGCLAGSAWTLIAARIVQGLGAVSGPVLALLADLTRADARTRALALIGISIGLTFVLSLVAGPALAGAIGVAGIFALMGGLGLAGLGLLWLGLPASPRAEAPPASGPDWRGAFHARLLPLYAGVFALHLSLTAVFVAVPYALRDLHGIAAAEHWRVYLAVFAASLSLTVPLILWSERTARPAATLVTAGVLLVLAQAALAWLHADRTGLLAALVLFFGVFNFLEARLPASLADLAGAGLRGTALGVFATCQFLGAFAGGLAGGLLLGSAASLTGVFSVAAMATGAWLLVAGANRGEDRT
ncbi:MAG: MFS transporter [Gammaproteobacteria bacterium]|nr:MFS transporter [Gammaproteobacteria bacterium]